MFGMMPWGGGGPSLPEGFAGIFQFDGNLDNDVVGGFGLSPSSSISYQTGKFGQGVKLDSTGRIASALLADATINNGVMVELFAQKLTGSESLLMSLRNDSGGVAAAIYAEGLSSTLSALGIGVSTGIAGTWSWGADWKHVVLALYKKSTPRPGNLSGCEIAWAHNGTWYETEFQAPNYSGQLSINIADEQEFGSAGVAVYDSCRVAIGKTNFPYTIGVNFTPPTAPFSP